MEAPSKDLLKKAFDFDRKSQLELYRLCYPVLIAVARRYRKNDEDHMTLVNNAFIKIIQHLDRFDNAYFYSWIKRIMTNEIIDDYRRNKNYQQFFSQDASIENNEFHSPEIEYEWTDAHLKQLLLTVPESSRVVFNLFALDGFSHKEIGEMLGISEQTSKWHVKMARKKLKNALEPELQDGRR